MVTIHTRPRLAREIAATLTELTDSRFISGRAAFEPEAESRLALREKDWRRRKEKLDAACGRHPAGLSRSCLGVFFSSSSFYWS
jgi:hypothetical protein